MTEVPQLESKPVPRRRRRWVRRVLLILTILLLAGAGLILGVRAYLVHQFDKELERVMAELDKTDPGWRLEEIMASREKIPDKDNAAHYILTAGKLVPRGWPDPRPVRRKPPAALGEPEKTLPERVGEIQPLDELGDELATELRAELEALAPALEAARQVIDFDKGSYPIVWGKNLMNTVLLHTESIHIAANLLRLDSVLRAHEGDCDAAMRSARGVLVVGRSFGDEPISVSLISRMGCVQRATKSMERVLWEGHVSPRELALTGAKLEREKGESLLVPVLRGERGAWSLQLENVWAGDVYFEDLVDTPFKPSWYDDLHEWAIIRPLVRYNQPIYLQHMTQFIDMNRLPPGERQQALAGFERKVRTMKKPTLAPTWLFLGALTKISEAHDRHLANLGCAIAALAAERFRIAHRRWPNSLDELVPTTLAKAPEDPYVGGPLRFRRLDDGIVIYSVARDGKDDGGNLDRKEGGKEPGTDIGFRLWDVEHRRQKKPAEREP